MLAAGIERVPDWLAYTFLGVFCFALISLGFIVGTVLCYYRIGRSIETLVLASVDAREADDYEYFAALADIEPDHDGDSTTIVVEGHPVYDVPPAPLKLIGGVERQPWLYRLPDAAS